MKRFKEFINEGNAMDFLKPKSDEDIRKALKDLTFMDRIRFIYDENLSERFLPINLKETILWIILTKLKDKWNNKFDFNGGYQDFNILELPSINNVKKHLEDNKKKHIIRSLTNKGVEIQILINYYDNKYKTYAKNYYIPYKDLKTKVLFKLLDKWIMLYEKPEYETI